MCRHNEYIPRKKDAFLLKGHLLDVQKSKKRLRVRKSKKSGKAHFTRVTEVVESCQMCWNFNGMQHICNKYATNISMICIGHFQSNLGMSFSVKSY